MGSGLTAVDAILWGVITFSLLVVLHEGGHFLAARAFGVKVHEFMVGLPGPAIRYRGRKTTFGITAVPLGGYVRIAGMEPGAEDELLPRAFAVAVARDRIDAPTLAYALDVDEKRAAALLVTLQDYAAIEASTDDEYSYVPLVRIGPGEDPDELYAKLRSQTYRGKKTWQRITILAMGVLVNLVAAIVVFTVVLAIFGYYDLSLKVDQIVPGGGAEAAGMRTGDTIREIDGEPVQTFQELIETVGEHEAGETVSVTYERGGRTAEVPVKLQAGEEGRPLLGVGPSVVKREFGPVGAFVEALRFVGLVFVAIGGFFNPETFQTSIRGASSVVGASVEVARAAKAGPLDYAFIVALLSLSLGALNILPIPPLDGGKVAVEIVERVMGRPLRREISLGLSLVGTLLLFSLVGYLVYADVLRLSGNG